MPVPKFVAECFRKIWNQEAGVAITVGPDREGFECVGIYCEGKESIEYYGEIDLTMQPELALLVGQAIIDAAREILAGKTKEE